MSSRDVEFLILSYYRGKTNEELRQIETCYDVKNRIDEQAEQEMKDRLWYLMTSQYIQWYRLLDSIKDMVDYTQDEEEDTEEEEQ